MTSQPFLILGCSKRKKQTTRLLPAVDRYDGPLFQILRRHLHEEPQLRAATFILSAKFGLIPADFMIPRYDCRLSIANKPVIHGKITNQLTGALEQIQPDSIFVSIGADYWQLLDEALLQEIGTDNVTVATGSIGGRASQFANWLRTLKKEIQTEPVKQICGEATLRGTSVRLTTDEVIRIAKQALVEDPNGASRFETWFVDIGGERVAAKWLVSILFGKSVAQFRTADARRVLGSLGLECKFQAR